MQEPDNGWVDEEQTGSWAEERDWRAGEWGPHDTADDSGDDTDDATTELGS